MFEKLQIFQMASGLANHATTRQETIAKNLANADTPEYRAQDIESFAQTYESSGDTSSMRSTRVGHQLDASEASGSYVTFDAAGPSSPNGNSVTLETEMVKSSEARHQHDIALSVYKSSMNIIRTSIGRT